MSIVELCIEVIGLQVYEHRCTLNHREVYHYFPIEHIRWVYDNFAEVCVLKPAPILRYSCSLVVSFVGHYLWGLRTGTSWASELFVNFLLQVFSAKFVGFRTSLIRLLAAKGILMILRNARDVSVTEALLACVFICLISIRNEHRHPKCE